MSQVTIYQFRVYDPINDEMRKATRWGTEDAIHRVAHGQILRESAAMVDSSVIDADGFTERGFDPKRRATGFQRTIE